MKFVNVLRKVGYMAIGAFMMLGYIEYKATKRAQDRKLQEEMEQQDDTDKE